MSPALPLSQHRGSNFIIFHKICLTTAAMLVARRGQMFMLFKWGSKACWVNIIKESWSFLGFFSSTSSLSCSLFVSLPLLLHPLSFLNFTSLDKFQFTLELPVSVSCRAMSGEECVTVDSAHTHTHTEWAQLLYTWVNMQRFRKINLLFLFFLSSQLLKKVNLVIMIICQSGNLCKSAFCPCVWVKLAELQPFLFVWGHLSNTPILKVIICRLRLPTVPYLLECPVFLVKVTKGHDHMKHWGPWTDFCICVTPLVKGAPHDRNIDCSHCISLFPEL